jgi:outer membrane protein assembly factor BamB
LVCDLDSVPFRPEVVGRLLPSDPALHQGLTDHFQPKWVNAGAAHMTCFSHARSRDHASFWNIDADDTMFFIPPEALAIGMRRVEEYAGAQGVDCLSLDMYQTFQYHWSFGVTFVRNTRDYVALVKNIAQEEVARAYPAVNDGKPFVSKEDGFLYARPGYNGNVDWYFTYMRDRGIINAKSFYFENTHFAHVGVFGYDQLGQLVNGVYHWRDGKLWNRPVMHDCIQFHCT